MFPLGNFALDPSSAPHGDHLSDPPSDRSPHDPPAYRNASTFSIPTITGGYTRDVTHFKLAIRPDCTLNRPSSFFGEYDR